MNRPWPLLISLAAFFLPLVDGSMSLAQLVIAHRGASFDAPENTLAAFRLAAAARNAQRCRARDHL